MTNYANQNIQEMESYSPPLEKRRSFNACLLDFNERTIPVSPLVKKSLLDFIQKDQIQIYPEYNGLLGRISDYTGLDEESIMISNGSDQGIDLIFRTFTSKADKVIIPSPSFAMFFQCAQIMENEVIKPLYGKDGAFPLAEVLDSINKELKLLVLCNPNNPTGTIISLKDIEKITQKALKFQTMVFVDEAYFEFSKITVAELVNKYPNLIISRTFSKAFGLASLRIGYLLSRKENIQEMLKTRGPYDVNMPSVVAAQAALMDLISLNQYVDEVMDESKPMMERFFRKNNIKFYPSCANFILFESDNYQKIIKKGFRIRPREGKIRITIGTVRQMKNFINQFKNA
jgi:histidinol-phosphate aminotransferase